mgnify:CR=1 FL=1
MSRLVERYNISVAVFFRLRIPPPALKRIFSGDEFSSPPSPPTVEIAPGIVVGVGPPREVIALYKNQVKIEYAHDKPMLHIIGPLEEVTKLLRKLPDMFKDYEFNLKEMCRYYEIVFHEQPVDIKNFISRLKQKVVVKNLEYLSKELGERELMVYRLSISNMESPLSDRWLEIILSPDPNAPHARVILKIVKRCPTFEEAIRFLRFVENMPELLAKFLE